MKKAEKSSDRHFDKAGMSLAKSQDAEERAHKSDTDRGYDRHKSRAAKHHDSFRKHDRIHRKRESGIERAQDRMSRAVEKAKDDLKNLSADDFQKKYRMSKAAWERKNK